MSVSDKTCEICGGRATDVGPGRAGGRSGAKRAAGGAAGGCGFTGVDVIDELDGTQHRPTQADTDAPAREAALDAAARMAGVVLAGKARGLVALWEAGALTDREAYAEAQALLEDGLPLAMSAELTDILGPMRREIRRRLGWV